MRTGFNVRVGQPCRLRAAPAVSDVYCPVPPGRRPSRLKEKTLKIIDTSNPRLAAERISDEIAALDYVVETVRLPDLHLKEGMEAPSSFVVATKNSIVPHLVSESINDGMGLIATGVNADDVSPEQLEAILVFANKAGAKSKMTPTAYSWTPELLEAACRAGAEPLLEHYGLDPRFLDTIEERGRATAEPLS